MVLEEILESPLYNKEIKPVNLKRNQLLIPVFSAEASTEGLQVERTFGSTAKVPNHGSSKQTVCSPTYGEAQKGSVYPGSRDTHVAFSPAASEAKEGALPALEEGDGSGIHWGHHLLSRTGKDRAVICGRNLVTGCGTNGN